jgi:hypothetical protein
MLNLTLTLTNVKRSPEAPTPLSTPNNYELPKEFMFVLQFKQTATGKINRAATLTLIH